MSTLATNAITDASGGNTASINSYTPTESNMAGRNRIINGDMRIDQRNAGSAYTLNGAGQYVLDRWSGRNNGGSWGTGVFSVVQSTTAPAGFSNSMSVTVSTADTSVVSTDAYIISQLIEGNNTADLNWGTSNAQTVTLSFWVRSSLTGTFAGSITSNNNERGYVFTYAISAVDTWQKIEATIPGDTLNPAHWPTNNSVSFRVNFDLGSGSGRDGTADTWTSNGISRTSGAVRLVETASATWYITGVQLEAGSVATPFERRQYGQELALCQRYYQESGSISGYFYNGTGGGRGVLVGSVPMRATPTLSTVTGELSVYYANTVATGTFTFNAGGNGFLYGASTFFGALTPVSTSTTGQGWAADNNAAVRRVTMSAEL